MIADEKNRIPSEPRIARRWTRYILGFGVSVAIGLSPYLGRVSVPLFTPLLKLIPISIQDIVLPLSAALMGIIAVVVQWFGTSPRSWSHKKLDRFFAVSLCLTLIFFVILFVVQMKTVARVPILGGKDYVSYVVGFANPPCFKDGVPIGRIQCIRDTLTLDPTRIESHFGDDNVSNGKIALVLSYLAFSGCFGLLIGYLVVKEEQLE